MLNYSVAELRVLTQQIGKQDNILIVSLPDICLAYMYSFFTITMHWGELSYMRYTSPC